MQSQQFYQRIVCLYECNVFNVFIRPFLKVSLLKNGQRESVHDNKKNTVTLNTTLKNLTNLRTNNLKISTLSGKKSRKNEGTKSETACIWWLNFDRVFLWIPNFHSITKYSIHHIINQVENSVFSDVKMLTRQLLQRSRNFIKNTSVSTTKLTPSELNLVLFSVARCKKVFYVHILKILIFR